MAEGKVWMYASLQHHASAIASTPLELQDGCLQIDHGVSQTFWIDNTTMVECIAQDEWLLLKRGSVQDYL